MTNTNQLIELYCAVCHCYDTGIMAAAQRQSNNFCPQFTDEECITIYLWGIIRQKHEVKAIHQYIKDYYAAWFPKLPSYQAFNKRICYLSDAFRALAGRLLSDAGTDPETNEYIIDSMPIAVAGNKRSGTARAASELCNKGYCASKGMYYYGVKLHAFSQCRNRALPKMKSVLVSQASECDLPAAKRMLEDVFGVDVYADKMYKCADWEASMKRDNNVSIITPAKLKRNKPKLSFFEKLYSSAVSGMRQPIESFFNWLQVKTRIQSASKIRSANGLLSFIFARISAACFLANC